MKLHPLIAIAAATVFAGAVSAQTPPMGQPSTQPSTPTTGAGATGAAGGGEFDKLDKDRDGSISKKEAASNKDLTKKWDTLDSNKDGKLDNGEFAQFEVGGSAGASTPAPSSTSPSSGSSSTSPSDSTKPAEKPKF